MALTFEDVRSVFSTGGGAASSTSPLAAIRKTANFTEDLAHDQHTFNRLMLKMVKEQGTLLKDIRQNTQKTLTSGGFGAALGGALGGSAGGGLLKKIGGIGGKIFGRAGMIGGAAALAGGLIGTLTDLTGTLVKTSLTQATSVISKVGQPLKAATMRGAFMTKIGNGLVRGAVSAIKGLFSITGTIKDFLISTSGLSKVSSMGGAAFASVSKLGVGGIAKMGGKILGKLALPITALFAVMDGVSGWNNADELLGRKADLKGKVAATVGNAVSGLTFGLTDWMSNTFGYKNTSQLIDGVSSSAAKLVKSSVVGIGNGLKSLVTKPINMATDAFKYVSDNLPDVAELAKSLGSKLWDSITGLVTGMANKVTGGISDAWSWLFGPSDTAGDPKAASASSTFSVVTSASAATLGSSEAIGSVAEPVQTDANGNPLMATPWLMTKEGGIFWANQIAQEVGKAMSDEEFNEAKKALSEKSKQFLSGDASAKAAAGILGGGIPEMGRTSGTNPLGTGSMSSGPSVQEVLSGSPYVGGGSMNPVADISRDVAAGQTHSEYGGKQRPVAHIPSLASDSMGVKPEEFNAFKEGVAGIENAYYGQKGGSSNKFAGRYQMGAPARQDAARILGIAEPTEQEFLNNPKLQERMFEAYTLGNHRTLMKNKKYQAMTPQQRLGALGYAHNQGGGGASKWLNTGIVGRDAFGTAGTKYVGAVAGRLKSLEGGAANMDVGAGQAGPTMAAAGATGADNVTMTNKNATRNLPIDPNLQAELSKAATMIYGPGARVEVYSGGQAYKGSGGPRVGTTRHDGGFAADAKVFLADGTQVTGAELMKMNQYWQAKGLGGSGWGMQGGTGIHLDTHQPNAAKGYGKHWNYAKAGNGGIGYNATTRAMIEAGLAGQLPEMKMNEDEYKAYMEKNKPESNVKFVRPELRDNPMFAKGLKERDAFNARYMGVNDGTVAGNAATAEPTPMGGGVKQPTYTPVVQGPVVPTEQPKAPEKQEEKSASISGINMFDEIGLLAFNTSKFS